LIDNPEAISRREIALAVLIPSPDAIARREIALAVLIDSPEAMRRRQTELVGKSLWCESDKAFVIEADNKMFCCVNLIDKYYSNYLKPICKYKLRKNLKFSSIPDKSRLGCWRSFKLLSLFDALI
jgi:hypothetical protein